MTSDIEQTQIVDDSQEQHADPSSSEFQLNADDSVHMSPPINTIRPSIARRPILSPMSSISSVGEDIDAQMGKLALGNACCTTFRKSDRDSGGTPSESQTYKAQHSPSSLARHFKGESSVTSCCVVRLSVALVQL